MDPTATKSSSSGSRSGRRSGKGKEKERGLRIREDKEIDYVNETDSDHHPDRSDEDDRNINGGGKGDDDAGGLQSRHNLTSASAALRGLLRKLGAAGLDDFLPSSSSSSRQNERLKKILSGSSAEGEECRQVEALIELCEILSIGSEESLSAFSVDLFVPVLVGMLNRERNPDIMILAECYCIMYRYNYFCNVN